MIHKKLPGFSVVELLVILAILGLIGGGGYLVYNRVQHKSAIGNTNQPRSTTPGTTKSIDEITAQDESAENNIDIKHINSDQTTVQGTNNAAANIGRAYDESSF